MSGEATGAALEPLFLALSQSAKVAAYSGTTSICPTSKAGSYSSRLPTVTTWVR